MSKTHPRVHIHFQYYCKETGRSDSDIMKFEDTTVDQAMAKMGDIQFQLNRNVLPFKAITFPTHGGSSTVQEAKADLSDSNG